MSPAEANHDVGNRKLLVVIHALQEWRRWLEGSRFPFVVWTDHKNLAYLRSVMILNSRQALWSLFLGCFDLTLTFALASWNLRPDALSRQFFPDDSDPDFDPILSSFCVVGKTKP